MKTKAEIEDVICKAQATFDEGSKYPGMNYEQGVEAALRWVIGEEKADPMED